MNHLTPAELVDAAEGRAADRAAAHLARCAECQALATELRQARDLAGQVVVPEPSPLYWRHLSARVREQVAGETIAPAWRATPWREYLRLRHLVPLASAMAVVALVVGAGLTTRRAAEDRHAAADVAAAARAAAVIEPDDSEVWDALTSAAADVPIEDAHEAGFAVSSGAVDRAVQRMTPEELNELGRLLQTGMRHSGD